jgi:hypothetical protein
MSDRGAFGDVTPSPLPETSTVACGVSVALAAAFRVRVPLVTPMGRTSELAVTPLGRPETVTVTAAEKPPAGVRVTGTLTDLPRTTLVLETPSMSVNAVAAVLQAVPAPLHS